MCRERQAGVARQQDVTGQAATSKPLRRISSAPQTLAELKEDLQLLHATEPLGDAYSTLLPHMVGEFDGTRDVSLTDSRHRIDGTAAVEVRFVEAAMSLGLASMTVYGWRRKRA